FLAVMMYTVRPANSLGPAVILTALVAFMSSLKVAGHWAKVFAVGTAVISTFAASLVYRAMLLPLAGNAVTGNDPGLMLDILLLPRCVFGIIQDALSPFGTVAFSSFRLGKSRINVSQESLCWTLITQTANVTSAALFFSAIHA